MKPDVGFEFYYNAFCNGKAGVIPAESFERCIMLAQRVMNMYLNSCLPAESFDEDIKLCLCEVAEIMFRAEKNGTVKSETIDGYSVTFADGADVKNNCRMIILQRLGHTGLIYAGVE